MNVAFAETISNPLKVFAISLTRVLMLDYSVNGLE